MINSGRRAMGSSVWPGYVDALSALLMVVIFVVLIFTLTQFLLSEILFGKESELVSLHRRMDELVGLLGLEKEQNEGLRTEIASLSGLIADITQEKELLRSRVSELSEQSELDRVEIKSQLLLMASLQEDIDALRVMRRELEAKVGQLAEALLVKTNELGMLRDRSMSLEARLADEKERTVLAQEIIDQRDIRIQALSALVGEQEAALTDERQLTKSARAELVLLHQQITNLKKQLEEISHALKVAESEKLDQAAELVALGKRLNIILAQRVNLLEQYRSEFFGRLREILGDSPYVRVEGDRFVLQAELLFTSGSADLGQEGKRHLIQIADIFLQLSKKIPDDLNWILRIDGHTDRVPIHTPLFPSNWELSTARAVAVVRFLANNGIPENRMAATGFSKYHPIDTADTLEAYRKNRRIEMKLTAR
ncbi:MAG: peptidoglycan -binding protein [Desulfobacterales bacterium]|nr:peptidoglycan -binding protein [Desulfobacterales bacterium]MDX2512582.1 peptidoglycan -binding protein [Desulfobacterales bacterium]